MAIRVVPEVTFGPLACRLLTTVAFVPCMFFSHKPPNKAPRLPILPLFASGHVLQNKPALSRPWLGGLASLMHVPVSLSFLLFTLCPCLFFLFPTAGHCRSKPFFCQQPHALENPELFSWHPAGHLLGKGQDIAGSSDKNNGNFSENGKGISDVEIAVAMAMVVTTMVGTLTLTATTTTAAVTLIKTTAIATAVVTILMATVMTWW